MQQISSGFIEHSIIRLFNEATTEAKSTNLRPAELPSFINKLANVLGFEDLSAEQINEVNEKICHKEQDSISQNDLVNLTTTIYDIITIPRQNKVIGYLKEMIPANFVITGKDYIQSTLFYLIINKICQRFYQREFKPDSNYIKAQLQEIDKTQSGQIRLDDLQNSYIAINAIIHFPGLTDDFKCSESEFVSSKILPVILKRNLLAMDATKEITRRSSQAYKFNQNFISSRRAIEANYKQHDGNMLQDMKEELGDDENENDNDKSIINDNKEIAIPAFEGSSKGSILTKKLSLSFANLLSDNKDYRGNESNVVLARDAFIEFSDKQRKKKLQMEYSENDGSSADGLNGCKESKARRDGILDTNISTKEKSESKNDELDNLIGEVNRINNADRRKSSFFMPQKTIKNLEVERSSFRSKKSLMSTGTDSPNRLTNLAIGIDQSRVVHKDSIDVGGVDQKVQQMQADSKSSYPLFENVKKILDETNNEDYFKKNFSNHVKLDTVCRVIGKEICTQVKMLETYHHFLRNTEKYIKSIQMDWRYKQSKKMQSEKTIVTRKMESDQKQSDNLDSHQLEKRMKIIDQQDYLYDIFNKKGLIKYTVKDLSKPVVKKKPEEADDENLEPKPIGDVKKTPKYTSHQDLHKIPTSIGLNRQQKNILKEEAQGGSLRNISSNSEKTIPSLAFARHSSSSNLAFGQNSSNEKILSKITRLRESGNISPNENRKQQDQPELRENEEIEFDENEMNSEKNTNDELLNSSRNRMTNRSNSHSHKGAQSQIPVQKTYFDNSYSNLGYITQSALNNDSKKVKQDPIELSKLDRSITVDYHPQQNHKFSIAVNQSQLSLMGQNFPKDKKGAQNKTDQSVDTLNAFNNPFLINHQSGMSSMNYRYNANQTFSNNTIIMMKDKLQHQPISQNTLNKILPQVALDSSAMKKSKMSSTHYFDGVNQRPPNHNQCVILGDLIKKFPNKKQNKPKQVDHSEASNHKEMTKFYTVREHGNKTEQNLFDPSAFGKACQKIKSQTDLANYDSQKMDNTPEKGRYKFWAKAPYLQSTLTQDSNEIKAINNFRVFTEGSEGLPKKNLVVNNTISGDRTAQNYRKNCFLPKNHKVKMTGNSTISFSRSQDPNNQNEDMPPGILRKTLIGCMTSHQKNIEFL